MTAENRITAASKLALTEWLFEKHSRLAHANYETERCVRGMTGRPDAILVGIFSDQTTVTLSVEAKSMGTLRELAAAYDQPGHFQEAALLGIVAGLVCGAPMAAVAIATNLLLRKGRYSTSRATAQALGYPGDYRVLAIPDELRDDHKDLVDDLASVCRAWSIGLVATDMVGAEIIVEPAHHRPQTGNEWLNHYQKATEIRDELWRLGQHLAWD